MTAINRLFGFYSESQIEAPCKHFEQGCCFVCSFKDMHRRENCEIEIEMDPDL